MVILQDKPEDGGKDNIIICWSGGGLNGPHYLLWGKGFCLHIYEDGYNKLDDAYMLTIGQALDKACP